MSYYLLDYSANKKILEMHFEFAYFYFFLTHLELTINTFIRSRSSLENPTRFQTKMAGKVYNRFQTKKAQKPYPLGRHIPINKYIHPHLYIQVMFLLESYTINSLSTISK